MRFGKNIARSIAYRQLKRKVGAKSKPEHKNREMNLTRPNRVLNDILHTLRNLESSQLILRPSIIRRKKPSAIHQFHART